MHDGLAAKRHSLVEQTQSVSHTAFAGPGQRHQTPLFDDDLVLFDHMTQPLDDLGSCNPAEVVMLAAGENRGRNFVDFGGREDKHDMRRRLLQRLQQRIEG